MVTPTQIAVERHGAVLRLLHDRPEARNAESQTLLDELDAALREAIADDTVRVIVIGGRGDHFSAGHDLKEAAEKRAGFGVEQRWAYEELRYLDYALRIWDCPKPTIAEVKGACIAGGFMVANMCDLVVASDDAFFADPVVRMGIPGVEYFAHPWVMGPRQAKEFLFTGERISAARALELGMINRVVPRDRLEEEVMALAEKIATMPRFGLALTKKAINQAEDLMGLHAGMDSVFGLHHFAHAHNAEVGGDSLAGQDARSMAARNKKEGA